MPAYSFQEKSPVMAHNSTLNKIVLSKTTIQRSSQHCQSVLSLVEKVVMQRTRMLVGNQMVSTLDFGSTTLCIITHSTFVANVERD